MTVDNEVMFDFSEPIVGLPGLGRPDDECFQVTVSGGAADSGTVVTSVRDSVLNASNYLVSIALSGD